MPETYFNLPIAGIQIIASAESKTTIFLKCSPYKPVFLKCPHCSHSRLRKKAYSYRKLKHSLWGGKLVVLELKVPKYHCLNCRRYFMGQIPGILPKKRATEQFRQDVFHLHQGGITQKHLSETHTISASTVERWYQDYVAYRVKELSGRECPMVLGIDEHFFSRKHGYATTLVDLKNHKVFDVVLGRSELSLRSYLRKLKGRERVRVVLMDLSETYRSIIKQYFPNAMIVADRFHVIRMVNQHFMKMWQTLDEEGRKNRGLISLMRRHEDKLTEEQHKKLNQYLKSIPGLKELYDFKQSLTQILLKKTLKKTDVKDLIPQFLWHLNECLQSPWEAMKTLGRTIKSWSEPIVRMWRFSKTNGITEGLHNKMEMISRRAFGFRNFNNYRLRVIALCGWNGVFAIRRVT